MSGPGGEGLDLIDLNQLASQQMKWANELKTLSRKFDGYVDPDSGEMYMGVRLQYEEAVDAALIEIANAAEAGEKRPPAEDIRKARARAMVKRENPDLYTEFHLLEATIERMKRWLMDARNASITRQSVLKTERELSR